MELGPNQKKWIAALRSRKYKQTKGVLEDVYGNCCLGVACRIFLGEPDTPAEGIKAALWDGVTSYAPDKVVYELALNDGDGTDHTGRRHLSTMNDDGFSFVNIANELEKNPDHWFKESK